MKIRNQLIKLFFAVCVFSFASNLPANAGGGDLPPFPQQEWSWEGIFGTYDRQSAQRGYKVYKEVCASCHSMNFIAFRNLADLGYSEAQIKTIAAEYTYQDGPDDEGEMFDRPGKMFDYFPNPYPNKQTARGSNNGALPPDLSLMIKARHDGANYVHALLTGYEDAPEGEKGSGYYNKWFPGHWIAMAAPLSEDQVTFDDGTPATVEQMSRDVVTFLAWAAEPKLEARKQTGFKVLLYMFILSLLLFLTKRKVWSSAK